jgi:hypothetical protein
MIYPRRVQKKIQPNLYIVLLKSFENAWKEIHLLKLSYIKNKNESNEKS